MGGRTHGRCNPICSKFFAKQVKRNLDFASLVPPKSYHGATNYRRHGVDYVEGRIWGSVGRSSTKNLHAHPPSIHAEGITPLRYNTTVPLSQLASPLFFAFATKPPRLGMSRERPCRFILSRQFRSVLCKLSSVCVAKSTSVVSQNFRRAKHVLVLVPFLPKWIESCMNNGTAREGEEEWEEEEEEKEEEEEEEEGIFGCSQEYHTLA